MIEDNDATDKKKHSWGLTIYAIFNPTRVYLTSADVHFMFSTKTKVVLNIISVVGFQWSAWIAQWAPTPTYPRRQHCRLPIHE